MGCPGLSLAGNRWQSGFIKALQDEGGDVECLGAFTEPMWPRGSFRVGKSRARLAPFTGGKLVSYINLPGLRRPMKGWLCLRAYEDSIKRGNRPAMAVSYNLAPQTSWVGHRALKRDGIPWISIIADLRDPGDEWERLDWRGKEASGTVFLSWGAFQDFHFTPKLHLDGGISGLRPAGDAPAGKTRFVYTGLLTEQAGVPLLMRAFRRVPGDHVELLLTGKWRHPEVDRILREDKRARYLGALPEAELEKVCASASCFVNPRSSRIAENRYNFPSKLLEYLSYSKPVMSTWTPGLAPEYRGLLIIPEEETPEAWAKAMSDFAARPPDAHQNRRAAIRDFVLEKRLWEMQIKRFLRWAETIVEPKE